MSIKYDKHQAEWQKALSDPDQNKLAQTWMNDNTLNKWRHDRMLGLIPSQLIQKQSFLTIGDGRYGTDAHYLLQRGAYAHASDISDLLLAKGAENNYINDYSAQNAENLTFVDCSFDYVLGKETIHHLPRPALGIYEAIRVSRKGVILIEPSDDLSYVNKISVLGKLKLVLKTLCLRPIFRDQHWFEPVGNYGFCLNRRELSKLMLAMHLKFVAYKGLNDHYIEGSEFVSMTDISPDSKRLISKVRSNIRMQDRKCKMGLRPYSLICAMLFKEEPSQNVIHSLIQNGFDYQELPTNPYLS